MAATRPRSARIANSRLLPALLAGGAVLALPACSGGGGSSSSGGGPDPVPEAVLLPDFGVREDVMLGGGGLVDATFADLDGDSLPDLIDVSSATGRLEIGLAVVPSGFVTVQSLATPGLPMRLAVANLDAEPGLEIVVACESPLPPPPGLATVAGRLALYDSDASGNFSHVDTFELPARTLSMATGPLYAGEPDVLAVAISEDQAVWVVEFSGGVLALREAVAAPGADGLAGPLSVAVVDVGTNGLQDLVLGLRGVVTGGVDDLAWVKQSSAGVFDAPTYLGATVSEPIVSALGDLDEDGHEDVGVAQLDETTSFGLIVRNTPVGLMTPQLVNLTGGASEITSADFDGDGRLDLAASLITQHAVGVLRANQFGGYAPAKRYNVGKVPLGLGAVQLPGDDHVDLYCVNTFDVSLLRGDGAGDFRAARGYFVADEPYFIELEQLDGDGLHDAVSIDLFQRRIAFLRGLPGNEFEIAGHVALDPTMSETPAGFLLQDFDGDKQPDLLVAVNGGDALQLLRNPGTLPFSPPDPADRVDVGSEPLGIDSGDLSGDGILDVVVANSGDDTIQILIGDGFGGFTPKTPIAVPGRPLAVRVVDLDQDGLADAIVSTGEIDGTDSSLLVFGGNGQGQLVLLEQIPTPSTSVAIVTGDVNGDGLPEVAAGQSGSAYEDLVLLRNDGLFSLTAELVPVGPNPRSVQLADLDFDGDLDLVSPLGSGQLVALGNDGAGQFTAMTFASGTSQPVPFGTTSSALVDLDGNNLPELLLVSPSAPHVWVARNTSVLLTE